jgi:hypothetical protein
MNALWSIASFATLLTGPALAASWHSMPTASVATYRYEMRETVGTSPAKGNRMDVRLHFDGNGGVIADVISVATLDGDTAAPVAVDPNCAKAMSARPAEIASLRLFPLSEARGKLGDEFLAACAPDVVFLPLTDILNVVLVQASDRFHAHDLKTVGQSIDYPGFATSLDRTWIAMTETSDGGTTRLAALDPDHVTLDWSPNIARLHLVEQNGGKPTTLDGTEHFAFRLTLDAKSGQLERADALYDDLDVTLSSAMVQPEILPRLKIKRAVSITRLPG